MNKFVSGAIGVEVMLSNGATKWNFPYIPVLKGKRVKHIDLCTIEKTPTGRETLNIVESPVFVTIIEENSQTELIQSLYAGNLNNDGNRLFINKIVDLQRSYITFPGNHGDDWSNKSFYFVFWFDDTNNRNVVPLTLNRTTFNFIELTLKGKRTYFDENKKLKDKKFQNLLLTYPGYTPTGNIGIDKTKIGNKFLTLSRNNILFFQQVPLYLFYQTEDFYQLRLQNIQFDLQNSYIDSLTTTADDLKSVFFNCILDDNK